MTEPLTPEQRAKDAKSLEWLATQTELNKSYLPGIAAHYARMVPWEVVERAMEYFCAKEYVYKHHQAEAKAMLEKWRPTDDR